MYGSGSVFRIRIRIYKAPEYGSNINPDPDPQQCHVWIRIRNTDPDP